MTDKNYLHMTILVDTSGSMGERGKDKATMEGINQILREQKKVDGKLTISLYEFSTPYAGGMVVRTKHDFIDVKEAPDNYRLHPEGGTPLIYAAMTAIDETGRKLAAMPEAVRPANVKFVIATDGEENSPMGYTLEQLKTKVKEQTDIYKWDFIFTAADIDAFGAAASYGIQSGVQMRGTAKSMGAMYSTLNSSLTSNRAVYAGGGAATLAGFMPTDIDEEGNATYSTTTITSTTKEEEDD